MFNSDQVGSLVRSLVIGAGAFFVGKGWVTAEQVAEYGGAAAIAVGAFWGVYFHRGARKADLEKTVLNIAPPSVEDKTVEAAAQKQGITP